ncbi:pullulanase [Litchfieldia alkalitelluris]|uniref:pullulanase n=1 Tax=Litchfieldia alkalitelluris TaxID=304268 RepID=UPI000996704D|nr:pullulanase [Litchfieldia alkalitelluris]
MNKNTLKKALILMMVFVLFLPIGSFQLSYDANAETLTNQEVTEIPENTLRIHYQKADNNYENLGLWLWNDVASPTANWPVGAAPFTAEQTDSYGAYVDVELIEGAQRVGFLVVDRTTGEKEGGDKGFAINSPDMNEIWIKEGTDEVFTYEPVELAENTVRIHYDRDDNNYENLGLWMWDDVTATFESWPTSAIPFTAEQTDRYGAYVDVELKEDAQQIGFLVVNRETGEKEGGDKGFSLLQDYNRLWIKNGDDNVYISPYWETPTGIVSGEVLSDSKFLLAFTSTKGLTADDVQQSLSITDKDNNSVTIESVEITSDTSVVVHAPINLDNAPFNVTFQGRTVSAKAGWRLLDEMYSYDGNDLGATYNNGNVTLKLWAPTASDVTANFFDKDDASNQIGSIELELGEDGVWSTDVTPAELNVSDLRGYYYQYDVTNDGVTKQVLDPYAKSMAAFTVNTKGEAGPDGDTVGKAAIVDLSQTNPSGFNGANIEGYEKREDAIIWEVHVRDFTSDPSIEGDLNARWGTYSAFIDKLDYIKSLGVTHVQLLPVMAWYFGDETNMGQRELDYSAGGNEYNWGYDPHNYFTPDGAYSENPEDSELRIQELKELIDAIHDAGMGVVLDNVYTHMAKASFLNDIVPNYYAFQDANGNFIGGFGNNLATNHHMAEKLMIDSVKYWFEEFKIDGMRWDMMGDATYDSVQKAYDAAAEINPDALFIGEGWRTFGGQLADPSLQGMGADQDWMDQTDNVGVFSDEIRNELKSGFGSEGEPRFLTGGARDINLIFNNIKGQPTNTPADDPGDMVQYIAAHDNLPLYDVIAQSIKKDPAIPENDLEIHKRIRIGNAMILTSQGTAFIHAGQELGRTKQWKADGVPEQKYHALEDESGTVFGYFVHDSYDSSDAINMFDWEKATNADSYSVNNVTREYTTGLIELRRSSNAFRLGEMDLVNSNVTLIESPEITEQDLVIGYKNESTDGTGSYYVFVNADNQERTLTLSEDLTAYKVLVDSDEAGVEEVSEISGFELTENKLTMAPLTTVVIKNEVKDETTDPVDPVDPVDPADPVDSMYPVDPEQPVDPVDSEDPEVVTDPTDKEEPATDKEEKETGNKLPNTATNNHTLLLIGTLTLVLGFGLYAFIRARKFSVEK